METVRGIVGIWYVVHTASCPRSLATQTGREKNLNFILTVLLWIMSLEYGKNVLSCFQFRFGMFLKCKKKNLTSKTKKSLIS